MLSECTNEDRVKYLKFVSGRTRLPSMLVSIGEHRIEYTHDRKSFPVGHTW